MRIFVTGGTGFVGSHFLRQVIEAGHDVVALRRPGSMTRIPLTKQPLWVEGELDTDLRAHLKSIDTFVHLASHTPNPPYASLEECLYWNVYAALKLAAQAADLGTTEFLIAGSCFEYGDSAERYDAIPTDAPLEPTLSYPTSKAAATLAFSGFARERQLKLRVCRIFQVYGEGEPSTRLWPSLREAALKGEDFPMSPGEQVRDFIQVADVAKALKDGLVFHDIEVGRPRIDHVASGQPQSLLEFANHWWQVWGAKGQLLPGARGYRQGETMRLVPECRPLS